MVRRVVAILGAASAVLAAPRVAMADEPRPVSNEMRAEQLFRSGEKKFDAGRHAEACVDFASSLKLAPKLGTLLNVALCHETTGKLATAWAEFHHAAAWAAQYGQRDRREFAMKHIASIEPRLPRVDLRLPPGSAIANLELDGEPLPEERWYLPLFVDPGEHVIAVSAPGKERATVSFRVTNSPAGQVVVVPAPSDDPEAHASETREPPPPPAPPAEPLPLAGFVLVGIGGAGVVTGAAFGIRAMTADDADAKGPATVSTIAFGLGAAALAVGGYVLLTARPSGPRVSIAPRPGGAALGLSSSF
jgi:hypothetical protein